MFIRVSSLCGPAHGEVGDVVGSKKWYSESLLAVQKISVATGIKMK